MLQSRQKTERCYTWLANTPSRTLFTLYSLCTHWRPFSFHALCSLYFFPLYTLEAFFSFLFFLSFFSLDCIYSGREQALTSLEFGGDTQGHFSLFSFFFFFSLSFVMAFRIYQRRIGHNDTQRWWTFGFSALNVVYKSIFFLCAFYFSVRVLHFLLNTVFHDKIVASFTAYSDHLPSRFLRIRCCSAPHGAALGSSSTPPTQPHSSPVPCQPRPCRSKRAIQQSRARRCF